MSVGNLKDQGNKGNNFPYQLSALKLAGKELNANLSELTVNGATPAALTININGALSSNPGKFLVAKSVVYDSATSTYHAFLTLATIS